jgi:hypothetical protein
LINEPMGASFQLYFVTRTNHEARLDEPTGEEFYRLIHSVHEHPPGELRQIEALFNLDLSIFQSIADDVEFPVGQLRYELSMARRHGEHDRAAGLEARLDEVLRREALNLEQPPGAGWFEIQALRDVVERWRDQVAAHPEYAGQLHFPTGWQWGHYFSPTPRLPRKTPGCSATWTGWPSTSNGPSALAKPTPPSRFPFEKPTF